MNFHVNFIFTQKQQFETVGVENLEAGPITKELTVILKFLTSYFKESRGHP